MFFRHIKTDATNVKSMKRGEGVGPTTRTWPHTFLWCKACTRRLNGNELLLHIYRRLNRWKIIKNIIRIFCAWVKPTNTRKGWKILKTILSIRMTQTCIIQRIFSVLRGLSPLNIEITFTTRKSYITDVHIRR